MAAVSHLIIERGIMPEGAMQKRILMILPFCPNPIRGRVVEVAKQLMKYGALDIVCLDEGGLMQPPEGVAQLIRIPNSSMLKRIFRIVAGLMRGYPINAEYYNSAALPGILNGLGVDQYSLIYVHRLPLHRLGLKHRAIIYDNDDCYSKTCKIMSVKVQNLKRYLYKLDSYMTPKQERLACNSAAVVLVTAEREAISLREIGVTAPIEVYAHNRESGLPLRPLVRRDKLVISFHGKLSFEPNMMALKILNKDIAPNLDPERFELRIIGKCPSHLVAKFPNLKFTGYVDSIPEAIQDSDLTILPLEISLGFSNKVMEALSVGVPIITTPGVIDGLPPMQELLENGVYVREIQSFIEEIERFYVMGLEQREIISKNCYEWVRAVYSDPKHDQLWDMMAQLADS